MVNPTGALRIAAVLFPQFTSLDVFGPLGAMNSLSLRFPMSISVLSHNMDPVSIDRNIINGVSVGDRANTASPYFTEYVLPTHTFDNAPEFDVLFVPGGSGTRNNTATQPAVDWMTRVLGDSEEDWPQYVLSVCTGAALLARTGKFGGKNATTNKAAFNWVRSVQGAEDINWIARARWVVDGKLWSSSGVSAGTDMTLGWIEHLHGRNQSETMRVMMEWNKLEQEDDPFADYYGLTDDRPSCGKI